MLVSITIAAGASSMYSDTTANIIQKRRAVSVAQLKAIPTERRDKRGRVGSRDALGKATGRCWCVHEYRREVSVREARQVSHDLHVRRGHSTRRDQKVSVAALFREVSRN